MISSGESNISPDPSAIFPFDLDQFQIEAIEALNLGNSVVVSAPTGSGKTLIGEYSIHRAIAHKQKVFYTTPLKALSNQKLRDFREMFGPENVGLMTGDLSVNRDAAVVVMTTEIFRNMLYAEVNVNDDPLTDVEVVVLDECHYMNDVQRGTVWEESIIHCPSFIQIIALSATVENAHQLTDWIERVHGPTQLVRSESRPVPLHFNFCSAKGMHDLLNENGTGLHPNCKVWRAPKGSKRKARTQKPPQPEAPSVKLVVSKMAERDMLPAIYFIFSRRGCEKAVAQLGQQSLVASHEQKLLKDRLIDFSKENPEALRDQLHLDALLRGIASHHAGLLPVWKELIEELFQKGLIKVVFATETLAAGINMPARTTVISSLSKRTEGGHRQLTGSEFLQMAGRAGRRGLDSKGYVVTVQTRFEGAREAGQLATSSADPLVSNFTPSYGMVLNLLQVHDLDKAKELVERSFGRYLATEDLAGEEELLEQLRGQLGQLQEGVRDIPWTDFEYYEKCRGRLKEERRLLRILQKQAAETLSNELTLALQFASPGTLVSVKSPLLHGRITPAVIVEKLKGSGQFPQLLCLTDQNLWLLLPCQKVVSLYADLSCLKVSHLDTPSLTRTGELCHGNDQSGDLALAIEQIARSYDMATPQYDLAGEVLSQAELVKTLDEEIEQQPAHRWGDRKKLKKHRRRIEELETEIRARQQSLHYRANHHWETFLSLVDILQRFGCLENLSPTEMGRTVGCLRGENELWLGLSLMSGYLDDLSPQDLAGVLEAISTDINRPDLWSAYPSSHKSIESFHSLAGIRRELSHCQNKLEVNIPIWWNADLMGLVEAWALGTPWEDLISNTSLDEGDVVRIMRRTVDLLSQLPFCQAVSDQLRKNARLALNAINRFPVSEAQDLVSAAKIKDQEYNPATERVEL